MIAALLAATSVAATLTVGGSDAEFRTLTDALAVARPGDRVLVAAGNYSPLTGEGYPLYVPAEVTITGVSTDATVLDGQASVSGLLVAGSEGVVIERLALVGSLSTALDLRFARGSTLDRLRFEANQGEHVLVAGEYTRLTRSQFIENRVDWQLAVLESGSSVVECTLLHNRGYALQAEGGGTISRTFSLGTPLSARTIESSVVTTVSEPREAWCLRAVSARNVTVHGCSASTALRGSQVVNSIAAFNSGVGIGSDGASSFVHNLVWQNASGNYEGPDPTGLLGNLSADPLFRDLSSERPDLRLAVGSPAIDAGTNDAPPFDLDGVPRSQDGDGDGVARADIGAYEWGLVDMDGDGWFVEDDCDDTDPDIHPGAEEIPYDGIDQDCDGADLTDADGDGFDAEHQGGDDCDDTEASVHPGAWDTPNDGIDQDCDGQDAVDRDGDGWPVPEDCDDDDDTIHPTAHEWCDGVDEDCDGVIDDDCEDIGGCCDRRGRGAGAAWLLWFPLPWVWRRRTRAE